MKIKKYSSRNKIITSIVLVILLIASATTVYALSVNNDDTDSDITDSQIREGNRIKQDSIESPKEDTDIKNNNKPTTSSNTTDEDSNQNITIQITAVNQNDSLLQVRSSIDTITNDGHCTLTLTSESDGRAITREVGVTALAHISTCEGFDIPLSELTPGKWLLNLDYKDTSSKGAASSEININ